MQPPLVTDDVLENPALSLQQLQVTQREAKTTEYPGRDVFFKCQHCYGSS
jgi:hypothetical protein